MSKKIHSFPLSFLVPAAAILALSQAGAQTVSVYQTNPDQSKLLAQQPSVSFGGSANGSTTVTITPSVTYQQMDGFGGSFTDSAAYVISKLPSAQQSQLMQWFFSSSSGIGLTFLRQPMGASDFSSQGDYSYDDVASGQTDTSLSHFSISKDLTYIIPVLKQALAVNSKLKIELLPWSPPAWMKTSGTMNGGNFNDSYYSSLAQYFVKTIQAYQAQGVPIYAVAAQNEPENSNGSYPTETFSYGEEATFINNYLGPALSSAGLGSVKIFGYEHNWNDTNYPEQVLSAANQYTAGTAWHCYAGSVAAQSTVQAAYPSKGTWFTECSGETNGSFSGDLAWGMENLIIGSTRNYAKSVSEWNLALDQNSGPTNGGCTNCRGFVTINDSSNPASVSAYNVENYLYGHAAKFVVPGAYRIQTNSAAAGSGGIEDVAFQNPNGSMVLIAFNDGSSSSTFNVNWSPTNSNFSYTLPAGAAATFTWTPSSTSGPAPAAPSTLSATAISSSQINLSWTASSTSGVTYNVYRSTSSGFTPSSSTLIASSSGTTYSNMGLSVSTTYYYLIEATNSSGTSSPSNQANATTQAGSSGGGGSISSGTYYQIVNKASGSCIDDTGGSTSNGTVLQQWACSSGNTNQEWLFTSVGSGYYEVTTYNSSTAAWNVVNNGTSAGTGMQLWAYGGGLNEQFEPVLLSSGYYEFIDRNSGLCLNIPNGTTTNGQQLQIATCNGSTSESFTLNKVSSSGSSSSSSISTTSYYQIVNEASGSCIDDTGGSTSNGAVLQQWTCGSGNNSQLWLFTATGGGYYEVSTHNTTTAAWNVVNNGTSPGTGVQLWAYGGSNNEQFEPVLLSSGYYEFVDRNSGLCLNVPNGTTTNGQQLQINTCNGSASESFKLNLQ